MADATVPDYRCQAHDEELLDHETRLRKVARDVDAAHDKIRTLETAMKSEFERLKYKLYIWAFGGAASAVVGRDIVSFIRSLL